MPRAEFLVGGLSRLFAGPLLFGLNRIHPTARGLVLGFAVPKVLLTHTL